ncbi:hypothetical protein [Streptomyces sp. NPDC056160]|uniref:hypothetical protein n=1 Tax=Streptomyces sp. NPDC056160 TaxID=3345731 RepID=UPI0035E26269
MIQQPADQAARRRIRLSTRGGRPLASGAEAHPGVRGCSMTSTVAHEGRGRVLPRPSL